jgi:nifR3 family TIM-barrel protein
MEFSEAERPIGIQIFGSDTVRLKEAAHIVQEQGADFVDINFGCPVKKVVCDGAGAAWLREPDRMADMLATVAASLRVPLSIKIRTGWDSESINAHAVVQKAARAGVAWVAIHGRTRAQGYSGSADWELIREIAQTSPLPIIGNGDVITAAQGLRRLSEGYAHAVMIGRGALKNPWIFRELLGEEVDFDFSKLLTRHFELALEYREKRRAYLTLKKFMAWYAAGYPGASQFRASIFETHDVDELKDLVFAFFGRIRHRPVNDGQAFLMGGHG